MTNLGASPAELEHLAELDEEQGPKGHGITGHQGCPEMDLTQVVEHDEPTTLALDDYADDSYGYDEVVTYDEIIASHDQAIRDGLKELDV